MAFSYLLPISGLTAGITVRVSLLNSAGASTTFADGTSAKLATAVGGSSYFLYTTQWPSTSLLPISVLATNHNTGSLLGSTAFNTYDVITSQTGAGGISTTLKIEDSSSNPIQGAEVWITTDSGGANTVAGSAYTDNFGNVTFYLDAGTYYRWVQKPGYTFTNPVGIVVI